MNQTNPHSRRELHHDVDVTFRTHLAADRGPKQGKLLDTVSAAHLRKRCAVDGGVTQLNRIAHGLSLYYARLGSPNEGAVQRRRGGSVMPRTGLEPGITGIPNSRRCGNVGIAKR